jgi:hypothetical protein
MKSPVVLFHDPAAATQQLAKFSQEGSYIPRFINISIMKKNLPLEHRTNLEKKNLKKAGAHRWQAF